MEIKNVVLCGSTRFKKEFLATAAILSSQGYDVVIPDAFDHAEGLMRSADERKVIDQIYLQKIKVAEVVFVIDVEAYVGENTRKEIEYAQGQEKSVFTFSQNALEGGLNGN